MSVSIYTGSRRFNKKPLLFLMMLNACFAVSVLFAWTLISVFVAEPVAWATWAPIARGARPELFGYPFILLWGLPIAGVFLSWVAKNFHNCKLAYFSSMAPLLFLSTIFLYFYFVPVQYH